MQAIHLPWLVQHVRELIGPGWFQDGLPLIYSSHPAHRSVVELLLVQRYRRLAMAESHALVCEA